MNQARQQDKTSRMIAAFVAVMFVLALAGAAIPAQAQTYNVLYVVPGTTGGISNPGDWAATQGRDGNNYFGSFYGGTASYGTLFKVTPSGDTTIVYSVGYFTESGATLGTDGNFYGTNLDGGPGGNCGFAGCGQVYKITPKGVQTILYNFTGYGDGQEPVGAPIEATDGKFYGTTVLSSGADISTAYSVTSSGVFTTLHTFATAEGQNIYAGLVQATDGNFYGVAEAGGANGYGTIFKMTRSGTVTVLHNFAGSDGSEPYFGLMQASDGNLYGTTYSGGAYGQGVVFKITRGGTYTLLHSIDPNTGDGFNPHAALMEGTDGKLYGVTGSGGHPGTIFNITKSGKFKVLYTFCTSGTCTDGSNPATPLIQNTNGVFYGTTYYGGDLNVCDGGGCGVVFSLDMGFQPFVSLVRPSGKVGAKVEILGQNLNGTTAVTFNGTAASFTVVSDTYLTAIVPAGATTGTVQVTTSGGTLNSNVVFRVTN